MVLYLSETVDRIDLYLQWTIQDRYVNTEEENELVNKFVALYAIARGAHEAREECSPENLEKWRKAYYGTLNALDQEGKQSKKKGRNIRKLVYELIESKIDNSIPQPKMKPRYKTDTPLIESTEELLKHEMGNVYTKYVNDRSERSTYIDGTTWYKIWWDSLTNTHERSGQVKVDMLRADQVIPQPGIIDYRKLEYIFEISELSISRIYDLYGKIMQPVNKTTNVINVIT